MRVVGKSGVIMDLADHVATGLLSSGVVRRVVDAVELVDGAIPLPSAVVPFLNPAIETETPPAGQGDPGGPKGPEDSPSGPPAPEGDGVKLPPGNGSREVWAEFALANGKTEDDLLGKTQTQIRDMFKSAAE